MILKNWNMSLNLKRRLSYVSIIQWLRFRVVYKYMIVIGLLIHVLAKFVPVITHC